jgi:hypothetical protein
VRESATGDEGAVRESATGDEGAVRESAAGVEIAPGEAPGSKRRATGESPVGESAVRGGARGRGGRLVRAFCADHVAWAGAARNSAHAAHTRAPHEGVGAGMAGAAAARRRAAGRDMRPEKGKRMIQRSGVALFRRSGKDWET